MGSELLTWPLAPGANRWLGLWLDLLGALIVSSTAFFCIAKGDQLSPGLSGMQFNPVFF
jgi:hypothetical protein